MDGMLPYDGRDRIWEGVDQLALITVKNPRTVDFTLHDVKARCILG